MGISDDVSGKQVDLAANLADAGEISRHCALAASVDGALDSVHATLTSAANGIYASYTLYGFDTRMITAVRLSALLHQSISAEHNTAGTRIHHRF